jgi:HEAT repeat protein
MSLSARIATGLLAAVGLLAGNALAASAAPAAATARPTLDEAFASLPAAAFGESRLAQTVVADAVRDAHGKPDAQKALAARLAGLLGADASAECKRFACRQLALVGAAAEVPALAALLPDKDLSHMARYALERVPDAAAGEALLAALGAAPAAQKVGILISLGERGEARAVPALVELTRDPDAAVAGAAATALGQIGGLDAAKALASLLEQGPPALRPAATDAYLACADGLASAGRGPDALAIYRSLYGNAKEPQQVRGAALRGILSVEGEKALPLLIEEAKGGNAAVLRLAREVPGPEAAKALAGALPSLPPAAQAVLLDELKDRADPAARPAVVDALRSADQAVRLAALDALSTLGDAASVPLLAQGAAGAEGPERDAARRSLARITDKDADGAIVAAMEKSDAKVRAELLLALGARGAKAHGKVLLDAAADSDKAVRAAALSALEDLADPQTVPGLVALAGKPDADLGAIEKALAAACARAPDKEACVGPVAAAMAGAGDSTKVSLLRVLGRTGGTKALEAVRAAVKDPSAAVQDAAVRALADWPDAAPADDLLAIAKTAEKETHAVLALRGYLRLAAAKECPADRKLKMAAEALAAARRAEEKRQALGVLGGAGTLEALKAVVPCLDDKDLKEEAAAAAVKIAKALGSRGGGDVRAAMEKVKAVSANAGLKGEADKVLAGLK